jgi:hypothetical protein
LSACLTAVAHSAGPALKKGPCLRVDEPGTEVSGILEVQDVWVSCSGLNAEKCRRDREKMPRRVVYYLVQTPPICVEPYKPADTIFGPYYGVDRIAIQEPDPVLVSALQKRVHTHVSAIGSLSSHFAMFVTSVR